MSYLILKLYNMHFVVNSKLFFTNATSNPKSKKRVFFFVWDIQGHTQGRKGNFDRSIFYKKKKTINKSFLCSMKALINNKIIQPLKIFYTAKFNSANFL